MAKGAAQTVEIILETLEVQAPPQAIKQIIRRIALQYKWCNAPADADELAERLESGVSNRLRQHLTHCTQMGRHAQVAFNTSSDYMIQGPCFIEPRDAPEFKKEKENRARIELYARFLRDLTPADFEALCGGVLNLLGIDRPFVSKASRDEGIDFFGRWDLEKVLRPDKQLPSFERQLRIWLVGQAKHYQKGHVSTPDIRDLVGAIQLAKGRAYASSNPDKYAELDIRICDTVFCLFFSTGEISRDGWHLLKSSGVVAMDGLMLAAFLADQQVGIRKKTFDAEAFTKWIKQFEAGGP